MVGTSAVSGVVGDTSWLVMVLAVVPASVLTVLGGLTVTCIQCSQQVC